jgi:ATPase family associated with various cellular activities (AAA).
MKLVDVVHINEYFRRSVNIKSDLNSQEFLSGYICPKSSEEALVGLVKHVRGTGQGAFTWTGPYGAGKSSLVVLLSSMLAGNKALKETAYSRLSSDAQSITSEFIEPIKWRVLPVVGEPTDPLSVIGKAMVVNGFCDSPPADSQELIATLQAAAEKKNGVVLFIDEMGKFLEALSNGQSEADIYLFQQLAELANSSDGKIILIGVLHQSFNEYARNLSRVARDE